MGKIKVLPTQWMDINSLIPHPNNPRSIKDGKMKNLRKSIRDDRAYFEARPCLVSDRTGQNVIIAGNKRWEAGRLEKWTEVPVTIMQGLTEDDEIRILFKDNADDFGQFDWKKIQDMDWLERLKDSSFGITIPSKFKISIGQRQEKEPTVVKTTIKLGDTFELTSGDLTHKIICGDSTNPETVKLLFANDRANLLMTSPPYWVGKKYEKEDTEEQINQFIQNSCQAIVPVMMDRDCRIVINTGTGRATSLSKEKNARVILLLDKWVNHFMESGWLLRHIRHWIKGGGTGSIPRSAKNDHVYSDIEYLMTFYNPKCKSRGQEKLSDKWTQQADWTDIIGDKQENQAGFPIELPSRFILLYSKMGEIVFDPFLGNGTTMAAGHKLQRNVYGVELDPVSCQISINRLLKMDGKMMVTRNGKDVTKTYRRKL